MPKFAIPGRYKGRTVPSQHAMGKLDIRACWHTGGLEVVDNDGGCPTFVYEMFKCHPELELVAFQFANSSVLYHRPEELSEPKNQEKKDETVGKSDNVPEVRRDAGGDSGGRQEGG